MQHVPEVLETFNRLQWIQVFLQIKMNEENEIYTSKQELWQSRQ